jgi:hypothetical protein
MGSSAFKGDDFGMGTSSAPVASAPDHSAILDEEAAYRGVGAAKTNACLSLTEGHGHPAFVAIERLCGTNAGKGHGSSLANSSLVAWHLE